MFKRLIPLLLSVFVITTATAANHPLKLYEAPESSAKVIATVQDQTNLTPIFYEQKSEWVKLADTSNGNVGWAKLNDIDKKALNLSRDGFLHRQFIREVQTTDQSDKKPRSYRVIEYSTPQKLSDEEAEKQMRLFEERMEKHSKRMRLFLGKMLHELFQDFSAHFPAMFPELFEEGEGFDMDSDSPVIIIRGHEKPAPQPSWWERLKQRFSD